MRLWLEQKTKPTEDRSAHVLQLPIIHCSDDQKRKLQEMAQSRTIGIWRVKRAKAILGALDSQTLERPVVDLRVPPESLVKCLEAFSKQGLKSLQYPTRKPTWRENRVENEDLKKHFSLPPL